MDRALEGLDRLGEFDHGDTPKRPARSQPHDNPRWDGREDRRAGDRCGDFGCWDMEGGTSTIALWDEMLTFEP